MRHYFGRLLPPRASFSSDMTPEEEDLMRAHAAYLEEQAKAGRVLLYGPVLAPEGAYGIAIFAAPNETAARQIFENDPSVKAGLSRFELTPMRAYMQSNP